jgi:dihydrofolate reductase
MAPAGSVLLGRRTYQEMAAYWPQQDGNPFADYLNNSQWPKTVPERTPPGQKAA